MSSIDMGVQTFGDLSDLGIISGHCFVMTRYLILYRILGVVRDMGMNQTSMYLVHTVYYQ